MRRTAASLLCFSTVTLAFMLGALTPAFAATPPSVVLPDGTLRYEFGRRPSPVLVCRPRFVCDITLDGGESVLNMAIGDATHWVIAGGTSGPGGGTPHVFVKPAPEAPDTNLVITTTKRVYDVALRSVSDARPGRISFFYPDEDAAAKTAAFERQRAAVAAVLAGTPLVGNDAADSKYKVGGDTAIAPQRVFNDGVRTYIEWKALPGELPAVVSIAHDGTSQPANFRVVGNAYIVDAINPAYDLVVAANGQRRGLPERRVSIRHL